MKAKCWATVAFVMLGTWGQTAPAEEVEVLVESAKVKVGNEEIATVKQGDRLSVLRREGAWVAVGVKSAAGERRGWVRADQVRSVVEPGIGDASPAPAAPELIKLDIQWPQMLYGNPATLCFELSVTNEGRRPVSLDVGQVELQVDEQKLKLAWGAGPNPPAMFGPLYAVGSDGRLSQIWRHQLKLLEPGTIPVGGKVSGWLAYEVPGPHLPPPSRTAPAKPKKWLLTVRAGDEVGQLDLYDVEVNALGAKIRPAQLAPSVEVLEIGSRVNALNMGKLAEAFASLAAKRQPCVVSFTTKNCLLDHYARGQAGTALVPGGHQPSQFVWANVSDDVRYNFPFAYGGGTRTNVSEDVAVLEVLAQRPDAADVLPQHLTHRVAETRAAAARWLGRHRDRPGVFEVLAKAAADGEPTVRIAALRSLGGTTGMPATSPTPTPALPPGQPQIDGKVLDLLLHALADPVRDVRSAVVSELAGSQDARATAAVIKALSDADVSVRIAAARAAGRHPVDAVAEPLIGALEQKESAVAVAACESLGRLKAQAAIPALSQLTARRDRATGPGRDRRPQGDRHAVGGRSGAGEAPGGPALDQRVRRPDQS